MGQMFKFGLILSAICLSATIVLTVTYQVTRPKIEMQAAGEEKESLRQISPQADDFVKKNIGGMEYFEARRRGELIGYCVKITTYGYAGLIRLIAGVDTDGTIQGIGILEHQETPGLGARITEVRLGEEEPWFPRQFKGKEAEDIELKKNIDAITGATISSRAVTEAVRKSVLEFLEKIKR